MSSFVCTDYTILAITKGMLDESLIDRQDTREVANALRVVNEFQTAGRHSELMNHKPVNMRNIRKFTDEEIFQSCKCWLYQVDTDVSHQLDFTTLICSVKMLAEKIENRNIRQGAWKHAHWFGMKKVLILSNNGEWNEISKTVDWDLAA